MSRSTAKILQFVNIIGMVILMLVFHNSQAVMYGVVIIACIISIWLSSCLRCPHCGAWPRKGHLWDEYCPRCGEHLED